MSITSNTKDSVKELLLRGLSQRVVAKELGLSESTVSYYVSKYKFETLIKQIEPLNLKKEVLIDLAEKGLSRKQIAEELNVSSSAVYKYLTKYNLKLGELKPKRGSGGKAICTQCKTEKPISEFYEKKSKGLFHTYCRTCLNKNHVVKQRELKRLALEYKGGKCEKCGYCKSVSALEFHHRNPAEKEFNLARRSCKYFDSEIKAELDKCDLLCSNCHREAHDEMRENVDGV